MRTFTSSLLSVAIAACIIACLVRGETVQDAAWALAQQQYPDLRDATSALYRSFQTEQARLRRDSPSFFDSPEWPLTLARYVVQKASQPSPTPVLSAEGQYLLNATRAEVLASEISILKERRNELRSRYDATLHAAWQLPASQSIPGVQAAGKIMRQIKPLESQIEAKKRELATLNGQQQKQ